MSCLVSVYGAFLCDVRSSIACLQRVSWCCFYQVRGETSTQVSWCELEQRQTSLWDEANWFQVIYRISATLKQCPLSGRPGEGRTWASQAVCRLRGPGGDVGAARLCLAVCPCSLVHFGEILLESMATWMRHNCQRIPLSISHPVCQPRSLFLPGHDSKSSKALAYACGSE